VYEQTGIELLTKQTKFDIHPELAKQYVTGSIYYTGPLQQRGSARKIVLDILGSEILVLNPQRTRIHHDYSDNPREGLHAYCYCLEEIFAEKIRALAERVRPRDLYDVIHLHRRSKSFVDKALLLSTLQRKCAFKNIPAPTLDTVYSHAKFDELKQEWKNMLAHQVQYLPNIDEYLKELEVVFAWLAPVPILS
jgi:predicted nucleotidyltransferase component of viral defense system